MKLVLIITGCGVLSLACLLKIFLQKAVIDICEIHKCPYCYGTNLCKEILQNQIVFEYNSVNALFYNFFSVKNVYYGTYCNTSVVIKKLGQNSELEEMDLLLKLKDEKQSNYLNNSTLEILINSSVFNFHVCDEVTVGVFLQQLINRPNGVSLEEWWTILHINVEPLLLTLFNYEDNWPVPKFYGACGRVIVMKNVGNNLNLFQHISWRRRAFLALQLLEAADYFTNGHDMFRLYLTDISPDNIAVDSNLHLHFVDLENAILTRKSNDSGVHYSEHFEEFYGFSSEEICDHSLSDHNIYSVCRLLLSKLAPWPMMEGGLLHSPPQHLLDNDLFNKIEECVVSPEKINRFQLGYEIAHQLKELLTVTSK